MGRKKVNFGKRAPWRAVSVAGDEQLADNVEAPLDLRLVALARARMEFNQHAHFKRGELRKRLEYVEITGQHAGEIRVPTRHAITKAIHRLTSWGVFAPGSWSQCIRMPVFSVQNGFEGAGETLCPPKLGS